MNFNLPLIGSLLRQLRNPLASSATEHQVGVIPYVWTEGHGVYLLVTSRGTGKWIFPKGALETNATPREVALQEAKEEAGVSGVVDAEPIGHYRDWKMRGGARVAIDVALYPMRVDTQSKQWDEATARHRHWATLGDLASHLGNPEIVDLARRLDERLRAQHAAGSAGEAQA